MNQSTRAAYELVDHLYRAGLTKFADLVNIQGYGTLENAGYQYVLRPKVVNMLVKFIEKYIKVVPTLPGIRESNMTTNMNLPNNINMLNMNQNKTRVYTPAINSVSTKTIIINQINSDIKLIIGNLSTALLTDHYPTISNRNADALIAYLVQLRDIIMMLSMLIHMPLETNMSRGQIISEVNLQMYMRLYVILVVLCKYYGTIFIKIKEKLPAAVAAQAASAAQAAPAAPAASIHTNPLINELRTSPQFQSLHRANGKNSISSQQSNNTKSP